MSSRDDPNLPKRKDRYSVDAFSEEGMRRGSSVVLRVPGAVIEGEYNYLINPVHKDFKKLVVGGMEVFMLDSRLIS